MPGEGESGWIEVGPGEAEERTSRKTEDGSPTAEPSLSVEEE